MACPRLAVHALAVATLWLTTAVCAAADPDRAPLELDDGWSVARPSAAGFDAEALTRLTEAIELNHELRNVHAVVVAHAGRLVYEHYRAGEDERWGDSLGHRTFGPASLHDLRSVTKSVNSVLLGPALGSALGPALGRDYDVALSRPILDYFGDLAGQAGSGVDQVSLHHVLTMTAGLEWNEMTVPYTSRDNDEIRLYYARDPVAMVLGRPVRDPIGAKWYYNGGLTQVAAGVIQRLTGKRLDRFAEEMLFEPLGIRTYEWLGSPGWESTQSPSAASGLRLSARDLTKIGQLFLQNGTWQGRQVVDPDWLEISTRRYVQDVPWGPPKVYGYGYFWYPGEFRGPEPLRVIRAVGNGDQRLFVVPDAALVVTIFAGNYNNFRFASGDRVFQRVIAARPRS